MQGLLKRPLRLFGLLVLALVVTACGGGSGGGAPKPQTYKVSGEILDEDGDPMEGVSIAFSGSSDVATTGANGKWSRSGLSGTVTVTPSKEDYTFDPASRDVTKARDDVNFTGALASAPAEPLAAEVDASALDTTIGGLPIELTAAVTGADAAQATMAWTASGGTLSSDTGEHIQWSPPAEPGVRPDTYTVEVEVKAGGDTVGATVELETLLCDAGTTTDSNSPCAISNVFQLQAIADHLDGYFALDTDIEAGVTEHWSDAVGTGKGFNPIGTSGNSPFTGTFDGNGNEIRELFIDRPDENHVGLFGFASGATINGVSLVDADVTGRHRTGGLVGEMNSGSITDSYSAGSVDGAINVGGLVGKNNGSIAKSHSTGEVSGEKEVGGLVGYADETSVVETSYSIGDVSATEGDASPIGGLIGSNKGAVRASYSLIGTVTGENYVGGLVGTNLGDASLIESSYSWMDVVGTGDYSGGLVGMNHGSITGSYSIGFVEDVGGEQPRAHRRDHTRSYNGRLVLE